MQIFEKIYDTMRIVDPVEKTVIESEENRFVKSIREYGVFFNFNGLALQIVLEVKS